MKEVGNMEHWCDRVIQEDEWNMGLQFTSETEKKHITGPVHVLEEQ